MPFVLIPLDDWSQNSVYVLFGTLCLIASLIVYFQVTETMYKSLDEYK